MTQSELVEISTELAHDKTIDSLTDTMLSTYKDQDAEILEYTDEVQKIFDTHYDYFYNEIVKVCKIKEE